MKAPKQKTLCLKLAKPNRDIGDASLESLLRGALEVCDTTDKRLYEVPGVERQSLFLNHFGTYGTEGASGNFLGGELFMVNKDASSAALKMLEGHREVDPRALEKDEDEEVLQSTGYFVVLDNDLIVIYSQIIRPVIFEGYINWLLREKAHVIDRENWIAIADPLTDVPATQELRDVKSFKLKAPMHLQPEFTNPPVDAEAATADGENSPTIPVESEAAERFKIKAEGLGYSILKEVARLTNTVLNLPDDIEETMLDANGLMLEMTVKWMKSKRQSGSEFMGAMAHTFRNADPAELGFEAESRKGKYTSLGFKREVTKSISYRETGRAELTDIYPKLCKVLIELVEY